MAIREIVLIGNPVLRKKAKKIDRIIPLIKQLIDDMVATMYKAPGIGLAAPQVGVSKRVIVVDVGERLYKLINPKIVSSEGLETGTEGCLSVPGKVGEVERATNVVVKAMNTDGRYIKIEAGGFLAKCFQHEIDHLDGILYVDKATDIRDVFEEMEEELESVMYEDEIIEEESAHRMVKTFHEQDQTKAIFEL
ncbi:MAG: peptide deformylase [Candidatus Eremiobacteraeota bacterium]|nr:peptide deformylase [Candidatus Eremiobacteraeota bacterium]